jgi:tetratricopeptide (TPR) repeat protein
LRLGDRAGYRSTCNALIDLPPVRSVDQSVNSRPVWPLCLAPDALDDMSRLVNRAEKFFTENPQHERHFNLYVLGAALYRAGDYKRAAQKLEESIDAYPRFPESSSDTLNYQQLLLAMTKWQLGKRDEARLLLAETQPAVDKELQFPSTTWVRRTTLELFRDEADALIEPKEADEAVENKSGASDADNGR